MIWVLSFIKIHDNNMQYHLLFLHNIDALSRVLIEVWYIIEWISHYNITYFKILICDSTHNHYTAFINTQWQIDIKNNNWPIVMNFQY